MSRLLDDLENQAIEIFRKAYFNFTNPVLLYSIGKDSSVLLHLAMLAFKPKKLPFPIMHVDTGWKFREMIEHREYIAKKNKLDLIVMKNNKKVNPFLSNSNEYTYQMKTVPLLKGLKKYNFDLAFGGARRDEEKSRSKERVFSVRSSASSWDPKQQEPELWQIVNNKLNHNESVRCFPLSNWTEVDIWRYIQKKKIEIPELYFSKEREVVLRNNNIIPVDDDRFKFKKNEKSIISNVRFRTLGCYPLTAGVGSPATSIKHIINELEEFNYSERSGRLIDFDQPSSMERKKKDGYF
jgi:sulfate adenylyltransferase subunit 2